MRRIENFDSYKGILPYASEIFGVYQPLLGWKSRRINRRFRKAFAVDRARAYLKLFRTMRPAVDYEAPPASLHGRETFLQVNKIGLAKVTQSRKQNSSFLVDDIRARMSGDPSDQDWDNLLSDRNLTRQLTRVVRDKFAPTIVNSLGGSINDAGSLNQVIAEQAMHESQMAGYLAELRKAGAKDKLAELFSVKPDLWKKFAAFIRYRDPLDYIDPHKDLGRVIVSPISVVHLFRQYFFEFDTFLGTPVGHVWLSPGSQVELVEVSTRKTIIERTVGTEFEMTVKSDRETTSLEELSSAVRDENQSNTAFGFTTTVNQGWIGGSASASSSINLDKTQKKSREVTHKSMRQQTERLSKEIRRNYKSTFKTVSEVTDTSSKRYLLNNTTDKLINYEMRRKMRQVGTQVQDIGTYLCWQTYVDDPGRSLGISKLVHIAEPPDLAAIQQPDEVPAPEAHVSELAITIPFEPRTNDTNSDDMDETYKNGVETDTDCNEGTPEKVKWKFHGYSDICPHTGYQLDKITFDYGTADMRARAYNVDTSTPGKVNFSIKVRHVNFHDVSPLNITVKVHWVPTQATLAGVEQENANRVSEYNAAKQRKFKEAYYKAARERIKLASEVEARDFDDLRDEERIVVYRALIQDMLTRDLPLADNRTRHAVAELLNSIFDINKMLYFVAPEWWRPRLHRSQQQLGTPEIETRSAPGTSVGFYTRVMAAQMKLTPQLMKAADALGEQNIVSWGGTEEFGRDNYYITEESEPAPMGSSLGWLLQLDGDKLRNAFLNSPWVKAVVPIRPGREKAAFNWLQRLEVEGADGLDSEYIAAQEELEDIPHAGSKVTIRDAINHLCEKVREKHDESLAVGKHPPQEINDDNKVSATPIDKVYEHGFYANADGFKLLPSENFEIFDQWVEILPTDQVVPVEVRYDPITGRQVQDE
ncbi:MAG: peptidoglycan-binding protein [Gammaproteobacteria bacterium]|nr:peptidoglycan-binding protein [Gammaproteobacteria bacterium]